MSERLSDEDLREQARRQDGSDLTLLCREVLALREIAGQLARKAMRPVRGVGLCCYHCDAIDEDLHEDACPVRRLAVLQGKKEGAT